MFVTMEFSLLKKRHSNWKSKSNKNLSSHTFLKMIHRGNFFPLSNYSSEKNFLHKWRELRKSFSQLFSNNNKSGTSFLKTISRCSLTQMISIFFLWEIKFIKEINKVVSQFFYKLKQFCKVKPILGKDFTIFLLL